MRLSALSPGFVDEGFCLFHYYPFSKVIILNKFAAIIKHFGLTSFKTNVAQKFGEK
jgi:hypothetical protein